jgi:ATP-dependent RNA helicase DOB1
VYNSITEEVIRAAPRIGQIEMDRLPQELTRIFAEIVSLRRSVRNTNTSFREEFKERIDTLESLANNLETIAIVFPNHEHKKSVAFVSATAHYLLLQIKALERQTNDFTCQFTIDSISSPISAILLFLIGNSPADAAEVASSLNLKTSGNTIENTLCSFIASLAKGNLREIAETNIESFNPENIFDQALNILWENIAKGIRRIALILLGRGEYDQFDYFQNVIELSVQGDSNEMRSIFAGPFHLSKLLQSLEEDLITRGVINIPAPPGVDQMVWFSILADLALERPYLWDNHYQAIQTDFLSQGNSAILTFPTGAGKSTLSELKIASTYLSGQSVIYLVPTHALEDQIKENLFKLFRKSFIIEGIQIDAEFTDIDPVLPKISVMTPERCLTLLTVDEKRFSNVGLVVFDEFHLVHGNENRNDRRSLDSMFCLLSLFSILPNADYLLISAMVENGKEIANWVESITKRSCICFDSSWKPTRQMHGCIVFQEDEINALNTVLSEAKNKASTKAPSSKIKQKLKAHPFNYFSLKNIWDSKAQRDYYIGNVLQNTVNLTANTFWNLTSNRNEVAADLAAHFASLGIKTLVFVDNPTITNSTAQRIILQLPKKEDHSIRDFERRHKNTLKSLQLELGELKFSYYAMDGKVAVHHGNLLPVERRLNEAFFKGKYGLNVVVATATLAQGINLPAEVVIIAGDDRFDEDSGYRSRVEPHQILNAAGRAGRAGMNAQGVVFVIPGEIVTIKNNKISDRWWQLKDKVFSKSDQCLKIDDPIEYFLDSMQDESIQLSEDQKNSLLKLKPERHSETETKLLFRNSFAAFRAAKKENEHSFENKVLKLIARRNTIDTLLTYPSWADQVSTKVGLGTDIIEELGNSIENELLPALDDLTIIDCIKWLLKWIANKESRFEKIFTKTSTKTYICKCCNLKSMSALKDILEKFTDIERLIILYVSGENYKSIDSEIPGKSDKNLNKARTFVLKLVPDISFVFGVVSLILREKFIEEKKDPTEIPMTIRVLASCVREGFDIVDKLYFKYSNPSLSRVECHLHFSR